MECARLKNWHFFGIGRRNSPGWSWMVATQVTDIPSGLFFRGNFKKLEPYIGDMAILLSQIKGSITPNDAMIQASNI